MNMHATVSPGSALSAAQRVAMHVGPVQGLPHDPLALVLYARDGADASAGFAVGALDAVEIGACSRALMLAPSPGADRRLTESSGSFGGLKSPTNVAVTRNGTVYLVDRGNALIKYFDACDCSFKPLPCFVAQAPIAPDDECVPSPVGFVPLNQLQDPTALAVTGHDLIIVDRGHHRVVLMDLIGSVPRAALRLPASTGLRKQWTPFAAAVDSHGHIYVSDPDHARIDIFGRDGRWRKAWTGLGEVTYLAVDVDDILLAVIEDVDVDATGKPVPSAFEIIDGQRHPLGPRALAAAGRFACNQIAVDSAGRLYLGVTCAPPADTVFDAQGYPVKEKDKIAPLLYATSGSYRSAALDSRRRGCVWHRVQLAGFVPERTRIDIQTTTSDVELDAGELADLPAQAWSEVVSIRALERGTADALVRSPPGRYLWLRLLLSGDGQSTPCISQIVVEFPRVSLRRYLPGVYGMDPIGADFTDRFTSLFDTTLRSVETRIDTMHELFDPASAPADKPRAKTPDGTPTVDFLSWLASWVGITFGQGWPEAVRRAVLKRAACLFGLRGTYAGVWRLLLTFLGFEQARCEGACPQMRCTPRPPNCAPPPPPCAPQYPPLILEHFRLRRWLFVGAGSLGDDAVLWGKRIVNRSELSGAERTGNARMGPLSCPPDGNPATQLTSTPDPLRDPFHVYAHQFSVFVPARVKRIEWQRRGLERILSQEAPAHTRWQIEYVEPRFRVGVQSMVGLDSVIARVPPGMRLNANRLGEGSVLPAHPGRPAVSGIDARVGETMRLT
jgi:phage tail-like protein